MDMVLNDPSAARLEIQEWDEAWYSVRLKLHRRTLTAKYCDISDNFDLTFKATDFKNPRELEDFIKKFRPVSTQLQDNECHKVVNGMTVCAYYVFAVDDVRFYDAVVVEVKSNDHKFLGQEECTCTFELYWLRGPNAGKVTEACVAQISMLQPGDIQMDPTLSLFLEMCRAKVKAASSCVSQGNLLTYHKNEAVNSIVPYEPDMRSVSATGKFNALGPCTDQRIRKRPGRRKSGFEMNRCKTSKFHVMLIDNLEKDLSPLTIVEFLKQHVSVTCLAQIFPCSSSESPYTRGIVVAHSQKDLLKLSKFLLNPDHMIMSSRGRPWMILEHHSRLEIPGPVILSSSRKPRGRKPRCSADEATNGDLNMAPLNQPKDNSLKISNSLRLVRRGTQEYEKGKQLKDLFLEYAAYQRGLQLHFALQERRVLQM